MKKIVYSMKYSYSNMLYVLALLMLYTVHINYVKFKIFFTTMAIRLSGVRITTVRIIKVLLYLTPNREKEVTTNVILYPSLHSNSIDNLDKYVNQPGSHYAVVSWEGGGRI